MPIRRPLVVFALGLLAASGCSRFNRADPASIELQHANYTERRTAAHHHSAASLRVVTFNVHGQTARVLTAAIEGSPALAGADVIMLQEIEHHSSESRSRAGMVAKRLGMSYAYAPGYGLPKGGSHGVAILSRFPLRDLELIELPRYRVVVNSARRVALGATVNVDGTEIRLYSVHLDNRISPAQRIAQLAPAVSLAADFNGPVIIAGDVNTSPFSWVGHVMPIPRGHQARRLEAYMRAEGFDTPAHRSGPTSKWLQMRLDAVYTRGFDAVDLGVARSVRISDHLPLWVDLDVSPGTRTATFVR